MKLYVKCPECKRKIHLDVEAVSRPQLARIWGRHFNIECPHSDCEYVTRFNVNRVVAESGTTAIPGGAAVGGLVGLVGGPIGALAGAAIGSLIGYNKELNEDSNVRYFNRSRVNL